eukprot:9124294-Pyramimonas_sp.AAC.1
MRRTMKEEYGRTIFFLHGRPHHLSRLCEHQVRLRDQGLLVRHADGVILDLSCCQVQHVLVQGLYGGQGGLRYWLRL